MGGAAHHRAFASTADPWGLRRIHLQMRWQWAVFGGEVFAAEVSFDLDGVEAVVRAARRGGVRRPAREDICQPRGGKEESTDEAAEMHYEHVPWD